MKHLPRILGLTFLSLILTNCSLSSRQIASRLKPSIVKLSYRNQPGHGTGFFVPGEKGVCTVLTAAHVVEKEGERLLQANKDGKEWDVANVEIFSNGIDLALVTFQPVGERCNYPALKIGDSEKVTEGSDIYIFGFPNRGGQSVPQFVEGQVSALGSLPQGYGVSYEALTVGGMSGAPVMNAKGEVVAVHGMSDFEVVQNFASLPLSELQLQTFQQAVERVNGVQRPTFSWGISINWFRESDFYYGDLSLFNLSVLFCGGAIFGGIVVYFKFRFFQTPQVVPQGRERNLERQLENEQRTQREVEGRLSSEQNTRKELEIQLENERRKTQEVEAQRQLENEGRKTQEVEAQRQRVVESQQVKPPSSVDVLVSVKGVDYTTLRDLLVAGNWKGADEETTRAMLKVAGKESERCLSIKHIENFPCEDLGTIDKLWLKYSNGKFGFSVQKQIYQSLGGTNKYNEKVLNAFGDKVGWRQKGRWSYQNVTWDVSTPYLGHLPGVMLWGRRESPGRYILSRVETCRL